MVQIHPVQAEETYRAYVSAMTPEIDRILVLRKVKALASEHSHVPRRARIANWFTRTILRTDPCIAHRPESQSPQTV